jgi:DNA-binding LytR/AlgR family response regulator
MSPRHPTAATALIAEDEAHLRHHLRSLLATAWPELKICAEAANGREALSAATRFTPQVAFLDIRMPGLTGMEVARRIAARCHVVFVTAYDAYAVEAFENEAVDYLLKPVTPERLEQTVQRLKTRIAAAQAPAPEMARTMEKLVGALAQTGGGPYLQWLQLKQTDGIRMLPVDEVVYFKAEDKYTLVVTRAEESLIRKPIRDLAKTLDPKRFWRVHRGIIVNVSRIDRISRSMTGRGVIKLKDRSETLTVSRGYLHLFKQM